MNLFLIQMDLNRQLGSMIVAPILASKIKNRKPNWYWHSCELLARAKFFVRFFPILQIRRPPVATYHGDSFCGASPISDSFLFRFWGANWDWRGAPLHILEHSRAHPDHCELAFLILNGSIGIENDVFTTNFSFFTCRVFLSGWSVQLAFGSAHVMWIGHPQLDI